MNFQFNPIYIAFMIIAVGSCSILLRLNQRSLPLSWREKLGLGVGAFCGAMIGAKLPFALLDWKGLVDGTTWFSNGKTIMCGLAGAYLGVEIAKWSMHITTKTGDTFAGPVAIAVAIGRLACFSAGCCYGVPTGGNWGVLFENAKDQGTVLRHPTQLYESGFHFLMAAVIFTLQSRGILKGQLAKFYILSYLTYRFVTEFIRQNAPDPTLYFGLTIYQLACLTLAPIFIWLWIRDAHNIEEKIPAKKASE